jgi:hypothetical protein
VPERDRVTTRDQLLEHLVSTRLAGSVATSIDSCLTNCGRFARGDPDTTFGLSDWERLTYAEAVALLESSGVPLDGGRVDDDRRHGPAYIEPDVTLDGIERHRRQLAELPGTGARVLLATGHAFALLAHYQAIARALESVGCTLIRPLEGTRHAVRTPDGQRASIRYLDSVGALAYHGALHHTHRPDYMEVMLDAVGGPDGVDVVVADHGFAGAAVEAGVTTLSIADANDPGLPVAQALGRTNGVLLIDDGLNPSVYQPVTQSMLSWFG